MGRTSSQRRRQWIATRDQWTCSLCGLPIDPGAPEGSRGALTLDHQKPVVFGGTSSLGNVRIAHRWCNSRRGCMSLADWARGGFAREAALKLAGEERAA
jgi:5-methylcytosine-specific restriction endonuclease McrA